MVKLEETEINYPQTAEERALRHMWQVLRFCLPFGLGHSPASFSHSPSEPEQSPTQLLSQPSWLLICTFWTCQHCSIL